MAKKNSTGALSQEAKVAQDERYEKKHEYDYVVVGSGNSSLIVSALLANAGHKVCILEAHDLAGGYAHTFEFGDYEFCAQIHYIWGCGPGGRTHAILKKLGLENDITFNLFDPEGYDVMAMPDGKKVKIPYGWDKLIDNVDAAYPGNRIGMEKFVKALSDIRAEMEHMPKSDKYNFLKVLPQIFKIKTLIKYRNSTLQDLFDECKLSKEAQAVLSANAGDFGEPPEKLSLIIYACLFGGYNNGAYAPTKHFKYYVDRLVKFITDHDGCHIYYEAEVTDIQSENEEIVSVTTKDGKTFTGKNYICNMDPQKAAHMIGFDKFPTDQQELLSYEYSEAGVMMYLGLKDIDLREHGFGNYNIWHLEQWDMNKMWREADKGNIETPWFFLSTPTLHGDEESIPEEYRAAPLGHQTLEIATFLPYHNFEERQKRSYGEYANYKLELANSLIDWVEKRYVPNLRDHIAMQVVGSPLTNEDFVLAPRGNAYGSSMTPENVRNRLKAKTPFSNMWWCNASSGWAGIAGTTTGGVNLYMDLTGDRFCDEAEGTNDAGLANGLKEIMAKQGIAKV
jgi:all-trans-retinol 13,14-reductase